MRMEETQGSTVTDTPPTYSLTIDGRTVPINADGYLEDISDWSMQIAESMAEDDGVDLTEDHWILINFLHRFYEEFEVAPDMAILSRNLCKDDGDCRWTRSYILELFPDGARSACRYAGLPQPTGSCV